MWSSEDGIDEDTRASQSRRDDGSNNGHHACAGGTHRRVSVFSGKRGGRSAACGCRCGGRAPGHRHGRSSRHRETVVEEALGVVNEASIALVSGVVGLLGGGYVGYVFSVLRTLSESRNDRRDAAWRIYTKSCRCSTATSPHGQPTTTLTNPPLHRRVSLRGSTSKISTRSSSTPFTTSTRYGLARIPMT